MELAYSEKGRGKKAGTGAAWNSRVAQRCLDTNRGRERYPEGRAPSEARFQCFRQVSVIPGGLKYPEPISQALRLDDFGRWYGRDYCWYGFENRIHALVDRYHIALPTVSDLFGKKGRRYLSRVSLPAAAQHLLSQDLKLLDDLDAEIKKDNLKADRRTTLLLTVPGLGQLLAGVAGLEIDSIERFACPSKLVAYAGLAPTTHASGGKVTHRRLMKQSNKGLRWALVEAAFGCPVEDVLPDGGFSVAPWLCLAFRGRVVFRPRTLKSSDVHAQGFSIHTPTPLGTSSLYSAKP